MTGPADPGGASRRGNHELQQTHRPVLATQPGAQGSTHHDRAQAWHVRTDGATISPGDSILWDPIAGQAYCHGSGRYQEFAQQDRQPEGGRYISDVIRTSGGEFYRNRKGKCEDAPCCGCCTI